MTEEIKIINVFTIVKTVGLAFPNIQYLPIVEFQCHQIGHVVSTRTKTNMQQQEHT